MSLRKRFYPLWRFFTSRNLPGAVSCALLALALFAPVAGGQLPRKGAVVRTDLYGDPLPERAVCRLGTTRLLHRDFVTATAFSADGRHFASASIDGSVIVWDWPSGKMLHSFPYPAVLFPALRFSPDGRHLAARANGRVLVWNLTAGREVLNVPGSAPPIFPAAGKRIAWIEDEHTVRIDDLAAMKSLPAYASRMQVVALGCDPGGRLLTAEVEGEALAVYDPAASKRLCRVVVPDGPLLWAQFTPDARRLVLQTEKTGIQVFGVPEGKVLRRVAALGQEARPLTLTPDGKAFLVVLPNRVALEIRDLDAGKPVCRLKRSLFQGDPIAASFSPDGQLLALGGVNLEHAATFWNTSTGDGVDCFVGSRSPLGAVAFSPDGKEVASCGALHDPQVRLWDPASGRLRRSFRAHPRGTAQVAYTPDGTSLVTCGLEGKESLCVWDARTLAKRWAVKAHEYGAWHLAVSPRGEWVASLGKGSKPDDVVVVWDLKTGKKLYAKPDAGSGVANVAFLPATRTLVVGARFWQLTGADGVWPKERKAWATGHLTISADGRVAAVTGGDLLIRVVEVATGLELSRAAGADSWGHTAFAPDGRTLAVSGSRTRLFDRWTGQERLALPAAGAETICLAFAPDGKRLASVGCGVDAANVLIWDVADATRRPPPRARAAAKEEIEGWCAALLSLDAGAAYRAAADLASVPDQAVPRLRALAVASAPPPPAQVARWLADLDHPRFVVREKAMKGLMAADGAAEQVEAALGEGPSLEKKRRLEQVLGVLRAGPASAATLFAIRGVLVLEWLGTAESRALLREFAAGDGRARLTQEARIALQRLTGKPAAP